MNRHFLNVLCVSCTDFCASILKTTLFKNRFFPPFWKFTTHRHIILFKTAFLTLWWHFIAFPSLTDGKCLACAYRAKFMEISVVINHNVDELLVGILTQIRLKEELQKEIAEGLVDPSTLDGANGQGSSNSWIRNKGLVRASMKAKQMFTWLFGKDDDQLANCENFQVLWKRKRFPCAFSFKTTKTETSRSEIKAC